VAGDAEARWRSQAARRAAAARGAETTEDVILRALLADSAAGRADAARFLAETALLDRDYLEYWVDELGLQERWRPLR
jgi:hypothetical protein